MDKDSILQNLFFRKKSLPSLPVIFLEFNKLIKDPYVSTRKISDLIIKDQAMVAKIIQISNSPLYAKRQNIKNLANAITYLGLETLKTILLQISLVRMFTFESNRIPEFKASTFWEHSLATAYFAKILAEKLRLPQNENYYVGGLLHDLGKLLVYHNYPEKFEEIILYQIEKKQNKCRIRNCSYRG